MPNIVHVPKEEPEDHFTNSFHVTRKFDQGEGGLILLYEMQFQFNGQFGYSHTFYPKAMKHHEFFESKGKKFSLGFSGYNRVESIVVIHVETQEIVIAQSFHKPV